MRCDIETLSIDRVWKNHAENVYQKLAPDPVLILLNNPKQQLHARNYFQNFKIRYFEKGLSKSLKKINFIFSLKPSPF